MEVSKTLLSPVSYLLIKTEDSVIKQTQIYIPDTFILLPSMDTTIRYKCL